MTIDELRVTFALMGWIPMVWRRPIQHWGISKSGVGSISEDAWHPNHGPSVAPLTWLNLAHCDYQGSWRHDTKETEWVYVPAYFIMRAAEVMRERGLL